MHTLLSFSHPQLSIIPQTVVTEVLKEHGATADELRETKEDVSLSRDIDNAVEKENEASQSNQDGGGQKTGFNFAVTSPEGGGIGVTLSYTEPTDAELALWARNLYAGSLRMFVESKGLPGLIVSHEALGEKKLRVLRFGTHQRRRDYVRHLLTFSSEERLKVFLEAQCDPGVGFYVETIDISPSTPAEPCEASADAQDGPWGTELISLFRMGFARG